MERLWSGGGYDPPAGQGEKPVMILSIPGPDTGASTSSSPVHQQACTLLNLPR